MNSNSYYYLPATLYKSLLPVRLFLHYQFKNIKYTSVVFMINIAPGLRNFDHNDI